MDPMTIFQAFKRLDNELPAMVGKQGWAAISDKFRSMMERLRDSSDPSERLKLAIALLDLFAPYDSVRGQLRVLLRLAENKSSFDLRYDHSILIDRHSDLFMDMKAPKVSLPRRYFATRIEGGPEASGKQPRLIVGKWYDCVFSVKAEVDPSVGIAVEIPPEDLDKMLKKKVQVLAVGEGLDIRNSFIPLQINPRDYTSSEEAVNFNAVKPGPCNLQLLLMLDRNAVRTIQYDFVAVPALDIISAASPSTKLCEWPKPEEYHRLGKQELQISVSRKSVDELELHFIWGTDTRVLLPIRPTTLQDIEKKKAKFLSKYCNSIQHVKTVELTTKASEEFMEDLKKLGDWIFNTLFLLPSQHDLSRTGMEIQELLQKASPAPIQINAGRDPLPWMFLSDGKGALGLRHGVEIIPSGMLCTDLDLTRKPLRIVYGVAPAFKDIKLDDGRSVLDIQEAVLAKLRQNQERFEVIPAKEEKQWLKALESTADVIYAYCHGSSDAGNACLWMTQLANAIYGNNIVSSKSIDWSHHPLVILAACTSGAIDPLRAIGLANSFMARGARGYIGVEGEVPSTFASLFMERFFKDFFIEGQKPVGQVLFELRSHFLEKMNNPWGILFTQFCRSEIAVNQ